MDLAREAAAERKILCDFAERGGWWSPVLHGVALQMTNHAEIRLELGRVAVYKGDPPDPESVAEDLVDLWISK